MNIPRIVFVLPVKGGGGGANSVVQEALGLSQLGVEASIAVDSRNYNSFVVNYPELQGAVRIDSYPPGKLNQALGSADVVVATINDSVAEVSSAAQALKKPPALAYYVQDYEPLFYTVDSPEWRRAHASYGLVPGMALFAKTAWLQRIVYENHGLQVAKVEPSIDHEVFFPNLSRPTDQLSIVAMVRPKTPRRAPARTLRILQALANRFGEEVSIQMFGATDEEIFSAGLETPFGVTNRGVLRRTDVPNLLRHADLFLDLSDYQAFGRTGLEAMASGCIPVVPIMGGADEYAADAQNAYVVDTRSDARILEAIDRFVALSPRARFDMRMRAIETASRYTIKRAALSELRLFAEIAAK